MAGIADPGTSKGASRYAPQIRDGTEAGVLASQLTLP